MKMKPEHFQHIRNGMIVADLSIQEHHRQDYEKYKAAGHSAERRRWDLFWAAKFDRAFMNEIYTYLNDSHIDTALKEIQKEMNGKARSNPVMSRDELFKKTARILKCKPSDVRNWSMGGEASALDIVTPKELAKQIMEYSGAWQKKEKSGKPGNIIVYGRQYKTRVFSTADTANAFMESHPEYAMIGIESIGGKDQIHVALKRNKGKSISRRNPPLSAKWKTFTNKDSAIRHMKTVNQAYKKAGNKKNLMVMVEGPGDGEYTLMDLRDATENEMMYSWA